MVPVAEARWGAEQKCAAPYPHAALSSGLGFRQMTEVSEGKRAEL